MNDGFGARTVDDDLKILATNSNHRLPPLGANDLFGDDTCSYRRFVKIMRMKRAKNKIVPEIHAWIACWDEMVLRNMVFSVQTEWSLLFFHKETDVLPRSISCQLLARGSAAWCTATQSVVLIKQTLEQYPALPAEFRSVLDALRR